MPIIPPVGEGLTNVKDLILFQTFRVLHTSGNQTRLQPVLGCLPGTVL